MEDYVFGCNYFLKQTQPVKEIYHNSLSNWLYFHGSQLSHV